MFNNDNWKKWGKNGSEARIGRESGRSSRHQEMSQSSYELVDFPPTKPSQLHPRGSASLRSPSPEKFKPYDNLSYDKFHKYMLQSLGSTSDVKSWEKQTRYMTERPLYHDHIKKLFKEQSAIRDHKTSFLKHRQDYLNNKSYYDFRDVMDSELEVGKDYRDWVRDTYERLPEHERHNYHRYLDRYWNDPEAQHKDKKDDYMRYWSGE